ncbi:MAG TPA: family 10 glycosylhydrolase [Pseudonocardiaceae bacterium]
MRDVASRLRIAVIAASAVGALVGVPVASAQPADPAGAPAAQDVPVRPTGDCPTPDPNVQKRQMRAVWIASVVNIDWPSRPGLSIEQQKAEYISWLDDAKRNRLNTVIVQVRPTADAFWPSTIEPWSQYLTGVPGQDPGYDPMAFLVSEAHARNLEFHAWFNPYRVAMHADPSRLAPNHPGRVHPDWILPYGGKLYYDPGIPEVREHVQNAIMDAVHRYDIDGVHFDDYFYPYPVAGQTFADEATYQRYGAADFPVKADWRRNNTDRLIQELDQRIHAAKPWVKFGISPFAVWRNIATDPEGSRTTAGVQTYDDLYADTRRWVREEWIDYLVPQVYWNIGFAPADYALIVPWWSREIAGTDVQMFIGEATYKAGTSTQHPAWMDPNEVSRHLTFTQQFPEVTGHVFFSAKDVRANRIGNMDIVVRDHYQHEALPPVASHLGGRAPWPTVVTSARRTADGVDLGWLRNGATSYAVYRFDGAVLPRPCDLADARNLLTTRRGTTSVLQAYTDTTAVAGQRYTYVVTALDRLGHESLPSLPRVVR